MAQFTHSNEGYQGNLICANCAYQALISFSGAWKLG